eukprot:CAMPEP_0197482766 /NCGR_PEP_ID=MMETSP1309-20131121/56526_1 /TAXON_ID=464262 /ORGANISM="Genus nov. species nov., Strain RCC998" /LENGTH=951 /DNA_ID=CAMNT_0043025321 /DNA_START=340 /DNA_END=3195 /DNA_ORIENTATION=+
MSGWYRGVVKEVLSGDVVTIVSGACALHTQISPEEKNLRQEKRVTLSGLLAPRLNNNNRTSEGEEPVAWESREHLRKKLVGQHVVFKVDATKHLEGGRPPLEFGTVVVNNNENVAVTQVRKGLAKCKELRKGQQQQQQQAEDGNGEVALAAQLRQAEDAARRETLGIWGPSERKAKSVRKVVQEKTEDGGSEALLGRLKDKGWVPAVVESVGNPHVLKVVIPEGDLGQHTACTVFVAGVACPLASRKAREGEEGTQPQAEPFAVKAKVFVETFALNQDVQVKVEGLDKYANLYVSISRTYPGGVTVNLAEALLKEGLGKTIDWSSRMLSSLSASKLRQAENVAKAGKTGIWHSYVASESNNALTGEFKAVVTEVVSGDTLNLWLPKEKCEKRVQLSSIRAPRMPSRANNNTGEPYAVQAKEFLRQKAVGKEVTVKMEYQRKVPIGGAAPVEGAAEQQQQQTRVLSFAHVTLEERSQGVMRTSSLSELLLARGLATTQKHRSDDDRSAVYEDLVEAESKALKSRKGLHSGKKPAPPGRINDLSTSSSQSKSKQFLPFLQRSDRVHALVDYVLSGHRFKLHIPKDSLNITFALCDVRCPGKGAPYSEEAMKYARLHCMQRDVEIEVVDIDRMGTFTGRLYLQPKRIDFAQSLLASGLAAIQGYGVPAGSPLVAAQNRARDAQLNMWKDYKEPAEQDTRGKGGAGAGGAQAAKEVEVVKIRAVNVISGSLFYAQRVDDSTDALLKEIGSLSLSDAAGGKFQVGEVVLCKYAGDGQVYRAKIESYDGQKKSYSVFYIDFGNREVAPEKDISPIALNLKAASPLAFACQLAFVKAPGLQDDFGYEAAECLQSLVGRGQILAAQVEDRISEVVQGRKPETILKVSVSDPETNENVALEMVRNGLARVERTRRFTQTKEAVKVLKEEEEIAKKDRLNMWQYGDVGSDDEDGPPAWGRK